MSSREGKRWQRAFVPWCKRLGLSHYTVVSEIVDEPEKAGGTQRTSDWASPAASTYTAPQYRQARVKVGREWLQTIDDDELEMVARHEALHIVLGPLSEVCREMIEALPGRQGDGFFQWWARANEEVVTHLTEDYPDAGEKMT